MTDHPASWRMPTPEQMEKLASEQEYWDEVLRDPRAAGKPWLVANEFLESEVRELMQAVSHAYVRGRFNTYRAD
jgi:hypothetical protein